MKNDKRSDYQLYIDILRVIACFSVVMLHASAQAWYDLPVESVSFKICNSYDALFRFGVPVFVMISGALFLAPEKELNVKKLYGHNILRLAVIYILWSCAYGLKDCRTFIISQVGWKDIVKEMIMGRYHLWYLPMLIGIYMLLPVLKVWITHASKKNIEYFLCLFFVFQILSETISAFHFSDTLGYVLTLIKPEMVCSYIGYFVLGYYLVHIGIPGKCHKFLYIAAVLSCVLNVVLGNYLAVRAGEPTGAIYDSFGLFTMLISMGLVIWVKETFAGMIWNGKTKKVIREISDATLGIYVMHVGLIEILEEHGVHSRMMPLIFGIPFLAVLSFVVCFVLSAVMRRIPVIGKYIC
ncbi:MAG: acyltransferase family protein [Lachnospiraceae bacterium]|nr:acyltransferase family protein [Lachnospiraceae bacterium]